MKYITIFLSVIILSSCGTKFSLQKRKYTKGFYYASHHKSKSVENQSLSSASIKNPTNNEIVETVIVKPNEQNKVIVNTTTVKATNEFKKAIKHPFSIKSNVQHFTTFASTIKPQIGKSQIGKSQHQDSFQKKAIVKKIIKILFGIISGLLITVGAIFYVLGLADSTFYLLAYACFAAALLFIILTLLIKIT